MEAGPYSLQAPSPPRQSRRRVASNSIQETDRQHHHGYDGLSLSSTRSMTSNSSSVSSSSSCMMSSPQTSFTGLRRSTFDLSDYHNFEHSQYQKHQQHKALRHRGSRAASTLSSSSTSSLSVSSSSSSLSVATRKFVTSQGAATRALLEIAVHDALSPTLRTRSSSQEIHNGHEMSQRSSNQSFDGSSSSSYTHTNNKNSSSIGSSTNNDTLRNDTVFLSGLEVLIEDLILGYLTLLHVVVVVERHLRGFLRSMGGVIKSWLDAIEFDEPIDKTYLNIHTTTANATADPTDEANKSLSMTSSTAEHTHTSGHTSRDVDEDESLASSNIDGCNDEGRDEWGHFADFKDELADESSFIPSCRVTLSHHPDGARRSSIPATTLQTLTEVVEDDRFGEDDDNEEEEWTF